MSTTKKAAATVIKNPKTTYEKFENWAAKNDSKIFYGLIIVCLLLSLISFNARISEAHDDALYLEGGWRFVHEFPTYFYTQNAPLYPLFLAVLIKIFGFKLILFKLVSVLFNVLGLALFYKALKGRLPAIVFIPVVVFQATNHLVLYYASMTFTEAFYFFLQGVFFLYAVKIIDAIKENGTTIKPNLKPWLLLGMSMFLISTAKSSAIVVIPVVLLFFALEKNWKAVGISLGSYLVFKIPYEILLKLIWTSGENQFSGQSKILLQKDPYDKALGNEDFSGFIQRLIANTNLSLGKRFYQLLGWLDEGRMEPYGVLAFVTFVVAVFGFYMLVKNKNKVMLLLSIYTGAQLALSYLILAARWDQARITLVCMQVLLILVFYALYSVTNKPGIGQTIYVIIVLLMIGSVFVSSVKRGVKNLPIVQKNLKGDKYFGYTPDWQNFLKCSEWCGDSLGKESLVASRKAPMSFVYGKGKKFFPIYSVIKKDSATNQSNPDSALAFFQKNKVTHVMLGTLRLNPNDANQGFINTVHNIMGPIAQKYPEKLKLVHVENSAGVNEEAYVYQILY